MRLTCYEYKRMKDEMGLSHRELAEKLGKSMDASKGYATRKYLPIPENVSQKMNEIYDNFMKQKA